MSKRGEGEKEQRRELKINKAHISTYPFTHAYVFNYNFLQFLGTKKD